MTLFNKILLLFSTKSNSKGYYDVVFKVSFMRNKNEDFSCRIHVIEKKRINFRNISEIELDYIEILYNNSSLSDSIARSMSHKNFSNFRETSKIIWEIKEQRKMKLKKLNLYDN